jgi:hypothetical protein
MTKRNFIVLFIMLIPALAVGRQIDFGQYYTSGTLTAQGIKDLDFGEIIAGDIVPVEVTLGSGDEGVIRIEGYPFLDVIVTITEIQYLTIDGNPCGSPPCNVTVNLSYAYTNNGIDDFDAGYDSDAIMFTSNVARFQIVRRLSGPPGPPPPPSITGVSLPPLARAYIYIFGNASAAFNTASADFSQTLSVSIEYM